jgi:hypothetical protein
MNKKINLIIGILLIIPLVSAIPETLNMQGKLTKTDGTVETGTPNFTFRLYDDKTAGNLLWEETQGIALSNGVYDAILGEINDISNLSFNSQYYITTKVGSDSEMTPRINLTSVPYAFVAKNAENLTCDSCIIGGNNISSTNFGIGTTSPVGRLTIKSAGDGWNDGIVIENPTTTKKYSLIYNGSLFQIGYDSDDLFNIETDGDTIITQGNLGIGTYSPVSNGGFTTLVDLDGANPVYLLHETGTSTQEGGVGLSASSNGLFIDISGSSNATQNNINFRTEETDSQNSPTTRMVITNSGNVGIGTASPDSELQISSSEQNTELILSSTASSPWGNGLQIDAGEDAKTIFSSYLDGAENVEILTLANAGNVGIGSTEPSAKLEITGTSGDLFNVSNGTVDHLAIDNLGNIDTGKGNFRIGGPPLVDNGEGKLHVTLDFLTGANTDIDDALNGNFDTMALSFRGAGDDDGSDAIGIGFTLNNLAQYPSAQINYIETMNWGRGALAFYTKIATNYNTAPLERMRIDASGNVTVWGALHAGSRTGGAIDIAELIYSEGNLPQPGDVLIASSNQTVALSNEPYDSKVVGIVSTKPHLSMGAEYGSPTSVELALAGRVPLKVTLENGEIKVGDLLTTSSTQGKAMKFSLLNPEDANDFEELKTILKENERRRNSVLGKSLENFDGEQENIMALITLQ